MFSGNRTLPHGETEHSGCCSGGEGEREASNASRQREDCVVPQNAERAIT